MAAQLSGLDGASAQERLIKECKEVFAAHDKESFRTAFAAGLRSFHHRFDVIATIVAGAGLAAAYGQSAWSNGGRVEYLVEAVLLLASLGLNALLYVRESRLKETEMFTRLEACVDQLRRSEDGRVSYSPYSLLVEGDLIQLAFGDRAPGRVRYCGPSASNLGQPVELQPGEKLKPSSFAFEYGNILEESEISRGQFQFELLETPLKSSLEAVLSSKRPETLVSQKLSQLLHLVNRSVWIVALVSLAINIIRFGIVLPASEWKDHFFLLLIGLQFYAILPLLPLSLPILAQIARSYGNAQIVCLFDLLQNSREEYKDEDGIDEFDAAPSPMKDVTTNWVESVLFFKKSGESVELNVIEESRSSTGLLFEDRNWQQHLGLNVDTPVGTDSRTTGRRLNLAWMVERTRQETMRMTLLSDVRQLFCDGNVDLIVEHSADYWDGENLAIMTETVERKIYEYYQNAISSDMRVVAYSYRPVPHYNINMKVKNIYFEDKDLDVEAPLVDITTSRRFSDIDQAFEGNDEDFFREVCKGQTFLGLAAFSYEPKPNVVDFIEDLGLAGIRFVYFSQAPERESKGYAEKLGLEINWNSCIILSPPDETGHDYLDVHDLNARLPRGIENIRPHLENVDDVPLHVSLFAECSPSTITEMVKIFQENGEVVCAVGSSLNELNVNAFATVISVPVCCASHLDQADIAVAVDPFTALKPRKSAYNPLSQLMTSSSFTSAPCALRFHFDTSPFCLTQLIREARTLVENTRQGFIFHITAQLALSSLVILSFILTLPLTLAGYQLLWLVWVILPVQTAPFLFTPHDPQVMTYMPAKNNAHFKDLRKLTMHVILRLGPAVLSTLIIFIWSQTLSLNLDLPQYFKQCNRSPAQLGHNEDSWPLLFSQNMAMLEFVLCLVPLSASLLHRTIFILESSPLRNASWLCGSLLSVGLQLAFNFVSLRGSSVTWSSVPFYFYIVMAALPAIQPPVHELVKLDDKKSWLRFQKFSKLQFNTKLGMHSPL
ncbi:hypothetical protein HK405_006518 [Cladochytrium tenue]|nr:hypothetical protein HK405_006518 [Cladochytrium tenue]